MENLNETSTKKFKREKYLANKAKKEINIKDKRLKPKEIFSFVTYNNTTINAVCISLIDDNYVADLNLMDYTFLCYSQNRLFYIHQRHDLTVREFVIKDLNQPLVNYCIIPEYDRMLAEVVK